MMKEDTKISRKQFLVFIGGIMGMFMFAKIKNVINYIDVPKKIVTGTEKNMYGNNSYGGNKK